MRRTAALAGFVDLSHVFDGPATGSIHPLRHDALQPHAADVIEYGRAVARQMLNELDRSSLGPADQLLEPPLAFD